MREQTTRTKETPPSKSGGFIYILIIAAAVIYVICATKAGDYLSEKVVTPVVNFFTQKEGSIEPTETASATVEPTQDLVTEEISLPASEDYLLQYGVFSTSENAENAAAELINIGGAGYIREEDGQYRVIISGYATKDDALNVKERLQNDRGMQTKLIELTATGLTCSVTSTEEHIQTVKSMCQEISEAHKTLLSSALSLDKGTMGEEDAIAMITDRKNATSEYLNTINSMSEKTDDKLIGALQEYYDSASTSIKTVSKDLSGAALSSALKQAYIGCAYAYYDLLQYDTND